MQQGGTKAIAAAFAANLGIAAAKFVGFAVTGSASMLAEAVHSVADTGNQGLLMLGVSRARRSPDEEHPFGYGRERYFWAFVVSIVLFTMGSVFALVEGVSKLRYPHPLDSPAVAIVILLVAIIAEGLSLRTAYIETRQLRTGLTWRQFIRRTKNPELSVVLLEDTGALIGLAFALTGIALAEVTGNERFDATGSLAIGVLLAGIAYVLARRNQSLLIGESADSDQVERIRSAIQSSALVNRLIHLRTLQLGPEELLVVAKVEFDESLDHAGVGNAIDGTEVQIRAAVPEANLIFIEPDRFRDPTAR